MFLYYREQNEFACNIFKTVHSITEVLTNMGLCVWENLNHNMIISILLSFVLGIMFGAGGLIAMSAAMISTVLSIPGYAFLEWAYDSPQAQKRGGNQIEYYNKRWKQALADLVQLTYKVIRIITFPIWATRAVIIKLNSFKQRRTA